jgi:hypothetical protein
MARPNGNTRISNEEPIIRQEQIPVGEQVWCKRYARQHKVRMGRMGELLEDAEVCPPPSSSSFSFFVVVFVRIAISTLVVLLITVDSALSVLRTKALVQCAFAFTGGQARMLVPAMTVVAVNGRTLVKNRDHAEIRCRTDAARWTTREREALRASIRRSSSRRRDPNILRTSTENYTTTHPNDIDFRSVWYRRLRHWVLHGLLNASQYRPVLSSN